MFGYWNFFGAWMLELGAWSFPQDQNSVASLAAIMADSSR
jgi:hypothetical protein